MTSLKGRGESRRRKRSAGDGSEKPPRGRTAAAGESGEAPCMHACVHACVHACSLGLVLGRRSSAELTRRASRRRFDGAGRGKITFFFFFFFFFALFCQSRREEDDAPPEPEEETRLPCTCTSLANRGGDRTGWQMNTAGFRELAKVLHQTGR
ncbi:uncharacterized protein LOC144026704 [Festucalex cinctus]